MDLIELDNCVVQPQAIFAVYPDHVLTVRSAPGDTIREWIGRPHEWVDVIHVILFNQEKRVLQFDDPQSRDKRYDEIVEQLRQANLANKSTD